MRFRNRFFHPESVARRAEDLVGVGQKEDALQTLYDFLTSRKIRGAEPTELESIGMLFAELGTEQQNGKLVKDGLHQFKKAVQVSDDGLKILEKVVRHFLELAEAQLTKVEKSAGAVVEAEEQKTAEAAAAAQKVLDTYEDDEENEEDEDGEGAAHFSISPEDILMSAVSTDDTADRSNRQLVVPWIRFLWECYRTTLDLLRNNSKLEVCYCFVCSRAFDFCVKYERRSEFRRLCELIRSHLQSVQRPNDRYPPTNPIDLSNADTLQRYLESRFAQLNAAVKLELWQEAFRSVEDVHTLMTQTKRQPKPSMLMNYYDDLAKIFAVSGDALFQAAAFQKYFSLLLQSPIATDDEKKRYASLQLLSALSVPEVGSGADDFNRRKFRRLASLLSIGSVPSRESLLKQATNSQSLLYADDLLKNLYVAFEDNFHPLTFARTIKPFFEAIESNASYSSYVEPLLNVAVDRIFREVSQVYQTIKVDFLVRLCTFEGSFKLSRLDIEKSLLEAARKNVVSIKIDQAADVIVFNSSPFSGSLENSLSLGAEKNAESGVLEAAIQQTPAELVRFQLSNLAKTLSESVKLIDVAETKSVDRELKEKSLERANAEFEDERQSIVQRAHILEHRKEELENLKKLEGEKAAKERLEQQIAARKAEQERAEKEAERRQEEKRQRAIELERKKEKQELIKDVNSKGIISIDEKDAEKLDMDKLKEMQLEKLEKDKKDTQSKMEKLATRNDYLVRAERKYELALLQKNADKELAEQREEYERVKEKKIEMEKKKHEHEVRERDRLQRISSEFAKYASIAQEEEKAAFEKMKRAAQAELEKEKQQRIKEFIEKKRLEFQEEQQRKKEEEDRLKKEQEEELRVRAAEEQRRKAAEELMMKRDPQRRLYLELLEKEKTNSFANFSEKMKLRTLKRKYGGQ